MKLNETRERYSQPGKTERPEPGVCPACEDKGYVVMYDMMDSRLLRALAAALRRLGAKTVEVADSSSRLRWS